MFVMSDNIRTICKYRDLAPFFFEALEALQYLITIAPSMAARSEESISIYV